MSRLQIVGIGSSLLLLSVAVLGFALSGRPSNDAPGLKPYVLAAPGAPETSGVAHEPAGVPPLQLDSGRATPSASGRAGDLSSSSTTTDETRGGAIDFVVRSVKSAASMVTGSSNDAPAAVRTRWTVVDVPVGDVQRLSRPGTRNNGPIATRPSPLVNGENAPVVDTDADWYAAPADDASPVAKRGPTHGRVARNKPLPRRDAGNASWYDSLSVSDESNDDASSLTSFEDALLAGMDPAAVFSGETKRVASPASGERRSRGGRGIPPELRGLSSGGRDVAVSTVDGPRWRLVKLAPPAGEETTTRGTPRPAPASALPAPHDVAQGEPAVVLASLGPKLSGAGATEFPGLAEPLPEPTQKPSTFCPIGLVEKKTKAERFCARADKTGITFREGPVSFLYTNGKKKAQGTYVNGKLEGAYVEFASNGKITAEGSLKKGVKNGEWAFWWDDGKKQSQGTFSNGERTGRWIYWDEKGRRLYEGEVRTVGNVEKRQGKWTFFHANGNKKQEGTFVGGKKDGMWKSFDEKGKQVSVVVFKDGEEEIR